MSKELNSNNYVVIQGWMCNELGLKGNELLIFALIYGFSQDGDTSFYGSRSYMANTFNISLPTVDKAIDNLEEKNLIEVTLVDDARTGRHNEYQVNQKQINYLIGVVKKLYEGSKETLLNNTNNTTKQNNKTISKDIVENFEFGTDTVKPKKQSLWDKCVSLINDFTDDTILREYLIQFLKRCLENSKESGIPIYQNTFKGKLNKLKQLSTDNYIQRKIALQTLDNGWSGFYELKEDKKYKKKDTFGEQNTVNSSGYTEEDEKEEERINKEREKKGMRTKF